MAKKTPEWAKAKTSGIVWAGMPFNYRINGVEGEFWCGSEKLGGILEATIFDYRIVTETRWKFPRQAWLDLAFIDALDRPAILPLKKESLLNVLSWLDEFQRRGVLVQSQRISLELKQKFNADEEPYYVCDVTATRFVTHQDFLRIQEFSQAGKFEWLLTGEIDE